MSTETDIVEKLRKHVTDRGGASIENGAWQMMLDAAAEITKLRAERDAAARHTAWAVTESGEIASLWMTEEAAVKIMAHHRLRSKGRWDVESVMLVRKAPAVIATDGKDAT